MERINQEPLRWGQADLSILWFVKKHWKEVFLYLEELQAGKTSDMAEQHFSI